MGLEKPKTAYSSGLPRQNVGDKKQKVPKLAEARLLFPSCSCLGGVLAVYWLGTGYVLDGYWLCYVVDVVGDDVVYVDAVYLI